MESIKNLLKEGRVENYKLALDKILDYDGEEKLFLYFYLLRHGMQNNCKGILPEIFNLINIDFYLNSKIPNLTELFPVLYLFKISRITPQEYLHIFFDNTEYNIEHIVQILKAKLDHDDLTHLLRYIEKLPSNYDKNFAHYKVFVEHFRKQEYENAQIIIEKINDEKNKNLILKDISILYIQNDMYEEGIAVANKIIDFENEEYCLSGGMPSHLTEIVIEILKLGKIEEALVLSKSVLPNEGKIIALLAASKQYVKVGKREKAFTQLKSALQISCKINDVISKIRVIQSIYKEYFTQNLSNDAYNLLLEAYKLVIDINIISFKANYLIDFSNDLFENGLFDKSKIFFKEAVELISKESVSNQIDFLTRSYFMPQISGEFGKSAKIFEDITSSIDNYKDKSFFDIDLENTIARLIMYKKIEDAKIISEQINNSYYKFIEYKNIALKFFENGDLNKSQEFLSMALEYVKNLELDGIKELIVVSTELFNLGFLSEADILVKKIITEIEKYEYYHHRFEEFGEKQINEYYLDEGATSHHKFDLWNSLIIELLLQNKVNLTLEIVKKIDHSFSKKSIFDNIYNYLITKDRIDDVERLIWESFMPF